MMAVVENKSSKSCALLPPQGQLTTYEMRLLTHINEPID